MFFSLKGTGKQNWEVKIPEITEKYGLGVQNEGGQRLNRVLPRECTGHSKHPLPTTQEKTLHMDITDGQHWNQIDYIPCSQRWRSSIQSAKTRPGADCGSGHQLLIPKFRFKWKKVGKITRPLMYDLDKITYDYRVEVTNKFKGVHINSKSFLMDITNFNWFVLYPWKRNQLKVPRT